MFSPHQRPDCFDHIVIFLDELFSSTEVKFVDEIEIAPTSVYVLVKSEVTQQL